MRFIDGIRARLRLLLAPGAAESRMEDELQFHVEMEAERLELAPVVIRTPAPAEAPTRTSISHTGIVQPGGPRSHRFINSGFV